MLDSNSGHFSNPGRGYNDQCMDNAVIDGALCQILPNAVHYLCIYGAVCLRDRCL